MFIFPPAGQLGPEETPASGSNYPFLGSNSMTAVVEQCAIFLYNQRPRYIRIDSIFGLGVAGGSSPAVNAVDVILRDTTGEIVMDTRYCAYNELQWDGDRWLLEWLGLGTRLRLIALRNDSLQAVYAEPAAYLDARCVHASARTFEGATFFSKGANYSVRRSDRTIRIRAGHNLSVRVASGLSARGERSKDIFLDAVPGEGQGKFEGCLTEAPVRTISNQQPSDTGDFFLSGDKCLTVKPHVVFQGGQATVSSGRLVTDDLCAPPCTCDDFTEVYQYAKRVWGELKRRAARAEQLRDDYHQIRDIWSNMAECAESNLMRVKGWAQRNGVIVALAGFCNPTDEPIRDVTLRLSIKDADDETLSGALNCETISRVDFKTGDNYPMPYSFEEPLPDATVKLECIPPGQMSYVVFQYTPEGLEDGDTVRLCVELDSELPPGVREQLPRCYDAKIDLKDYSDCDPNAPTSTTSAPSTTTSPPTTTTTTSAPTTTTTTTTVDYLTREEADDIYINTDTEIIDGGNF